MALLSPDNAVKFQHAEFQCHTGKVCQRLAGIKTSQRLVKPCSETLADQGQGTALLHYLG